MQTAKWIKSPDGQKFYSFDPNQAETENFIEMYLRPPFASEEMKIDDWIKVRQCGIRYYLSLGDQRIVDKYFIIRPKAEFEIVAAEASKLGIKGPWITKSYLEMILESKDSSSRSNIQLAPLPDSYDLDRGLLLSVQAIQALLENKGFPVIVGIGGPSGSGKTSLAQKMANIIGCEVNITEIRKSHKAEVPCFDFEKFNRNGFKEIQVSEESGVQYIEPHLVHAHLKIQNDFDPVLSPESSLFVLKSKKQVSYQDILNVLDATKVCSSVQNFTDVYLRLPDVPLNGKLTEGDCIRVRICEGRFALLIREPIREGNFIIQPKVDFDISASTVAGLLKLGYHAVAYIEASAVIYQDGKILIEVDHLQGLTTPYLQIKGTNKEIVSSAGSALSLDVSYTTKSYLQIILESLPAAGMNNQQAARLQELVEFIQSQGVSFNSDVSSPMREISSTDSVLDDMQSRIRKLERWNTINMAFLQRSSDVLVLMIPILTV
ncbi:hypothetical protein PR202_ga30029 [Eleusine coracana subsp. coracana]|uniref:CYTH domain-containing protein n=1 Tax=Eleusine coracana subsp. coracana TaxID=191504 RepID=A0AAV5DNP0_ELECO|nr:hypothetical protein PR202_ga30014 [Eleusine coracana subsp. coracana]GJN11805.1 hypothetical protein PR202_ga30029 [Eleusine coracana subsp. coracana]